jgi:hypothetical protein
MHAGAYGTVSFQSLMIHGALPLPYNEASILRGKSDLRYGDQVAITSSVPDIAPWTMTTGALK